MFVDDDSGYFGRHFREFRHNPCMMRPMVLVMFILFGIFLFVTMLLQLPTLVLGLLMAPILHRGSWYIEFLYPWDIGRWAHFFIMKHSGRRSRDDDKNRGFHSRTLEQRVEVVPGRVYIHFIPQWLDNVGYLIVCLPRPKTEHTANVRITVEDQSDPIVALMIDCGEADEAIRAIKLLRKHHYGKLNIQIQSIASTHKHHDHTGGNKEFMEDEFGSNINKVYAGAVDKVPQCTNPLANGDKLDLPKFQSNDMNELVEIEAVAVPAHTRGSIVYRMRSKVSDQVEYMFTGDTMFSGGGGVTFESDVGTETEDQVNKFNGNTFVRAGLGKTAMERCFAEVLVRALPKDDGEDAASRILIFPGHEYASELFTRQFHAGASEASRWRNFPPKDFFETVSQMYVAQHRRALPHNSGRLLMIPSTLRKEIHVSPHYRTMRKTGEMVVRAIDFWHSHFCKDKVDPAESPGTAPKKKKKRKPSPSKTASGTRKWNIDAADASRDIFTTVYTADLESVIEELANGDLSKKEAGKRLKELTVRLREPVINKRAIPNVLPSDKSIYKGVSGLAILGSKPSAMTLADSRRMNLPPPIDSSSDRIKVSMTRLLLVLGRLELLDDEENEMDIGAMIKQLWKEANEYASANKWEGVDSNGDVESKMIADEIELGVLKWVLFGLPANQPSWFSKVCCMPCSAKTEPYIFPDHPATKMQQKSGDLVSHDILTCLLCRDATGCVELGHENKPLKTRLVLPHDRTSTAMESPNSEDLSENLPENYSAEDQGFEASIESKNSGDLSVVRSTESLSDEGFENQEMVKTSILTEHE